MLVLRFSVPPAFQMPPPLAGAPTRPVAELPLMVLFVTVSVVLL
jgi:hypothetical protein